ncbi:uncharacterized protein LOC135711993 [Ochlerotatus camptorhynchus]|uniref:uncharacterized protein LOC135710007 n=1 Tax=Ochlerotatus camptorhynchus TaxID=644619 RepID=UPI0031E4855E
MSQIHAGINCDACGVQNFAGIRYACLSCQDYDLCESCQQRTAFTKKHAPFHPMQAILTQYDFVQKHHSTAGSSTEFKIYRCPHCGNDGFSLTTLLAHVKALHAECNGKVRCPVCVMFRIGRYGSDLLDWSLAFHIENGHMSFSTDVEHVFKTLQYGASSYSKGNPSWSFDADGASCNICSAKLGHDENLYRFLQCGHGFHHKCIDSWLINNHMNCPLCCLPRT